MKLSVKISSLIIAVICLLVFSLLMIFVYNVWQDRARLLRDNYNEQIYNRLFTSLRDYDDYGSAIEAIPSLKERVLGIAVYREDLTAVYSWGKTPNPFDENILHHSGELRNNRYTIKDEKNRSIKFILNIARRAPRIPPQQNDHHTLRQEDQSRGFFFRTLDEGKYFYIDIYHPDYWLLIHLARIIFPLCILLLFFIVFYFRNLFLRNIEYRKKIEDQKNLVVLGTAASTLAHEIKNPLLAIRLQTGILRKISSNKNEDSTNSDEINIIEEEVERISALVYRVNDYLRDAIGFPISLDAKDLLQETFHRLSGMNITNNDDKEEYKILIDVDRARSVFENIIRNAIESGGAKEEVKTSISKNGNHIVIEISDKGKGISKQDMARIFDPFFTSKSSGTGIGLSISKRFIEAAKGTITLQSTPPPQVAEDVVFGKEFVSDQIPFVHSHAQKVSDPRKQSIEGEGTLVRIIFPEHISKD
jgi:two-component system sensor histidine kinase HydH